MQLQLQIAQAVAGQMGLSPDTLATFQDRIRGLFQGKVTMPAALQQQQQQQGPDDTAAARDTA
jgi:hypothetical protein